MEPVNDDKELSQADQVRAAVRLLQSYGALHGVHVMGKDNGHGFYQVVYLDDRDEAMLRHNIWLALKRHIGTSASRQDRLIDSLVKVTMATAPLRGPQPPEPTPGFVDLSKVPRHYGFRLGPLHLGRRLHFWWSNGYWCDHPTLTIGQHMEGARKLHFCLDCGHMVIR